ncbi:MAG TPA: hypothetical protein VES38_12445 [Methylotenera sp.]|nr:hypothetical protein [Methylotenera sp.]
MNQLLGVHPDCLILSEVNPAVSVVPMARQASDWLKLIESTEVDQFQELPYSQQITFLDERAKLKGKTLIIRDLVTANYLSSAVDDSVVPSYVLEQPVYLARSGYVLQSLVVTRKAQSVYKSIKRSFSHLSCLSVDDFSSSYLAYAHAVSSFPHVSLEALQSAPRETLIQIMQTLGLTTDYIDMQLKSFSEFCLCTGNNTLAVPSASSHLRQIVPFTSDSLASDVPLHTEVFKEADRLMGY